MKQLGTRWTKTLLECARGGVFQAALGISIAEISLGSSLFSILCKLDAVRDPFCVSSGTKPIEGGTSPFHWGIAEMRSYTVKSSRPVVPLAQIQLLVTPPVEIILLSPVPFRLKRARQ